MKEAELFYQVMSQIWDPAPSDQVGKMVLALARTLESEVYPTFPNENKYNANLFNALQSLWPGEFTLSVRIQDCEGDEVAYDLVFNGDGSRLVAVAKDGIGSRLETID